MKTIVTFIDNSSAYIEIYEECKLINRKTVKAVHALVWMGKQGKCWAWGYDTEGHEIAETEE